MPNRRDFLKTAGATAAALSLPTLLPAAPRSPRAHGYGAAPMDAATRELLLEALSAATSAGASYADARIARQRNQTIQTREQQVTAVSDTDSIGCGVRVLVDGTWGFAATRALTRDGVARAARNAVALARANRVARDRAVTLAPTAVHADASWRSDCRIDPWSVPVEDKVALLLQANAAALRVPKIRFAASGLAFVKEEKDFASTEGSVIAQVAVRCWPTMTCTAVDTTRGDFATRGPEVIQPMGRGWEYVLENDLVGNAPRWAAEAAEKLTAKPVEPGRYDLILHPSQLFLTIHESLGHPTELDRAMGYEANYAGTSFIAPPREQLGKLRLGPEWMQLVGDRSQPGALATVGYDDEGVAPERFPIVKDGLFVDYQTTREQADWLRWWYESRGEPVRSHGCSFAQRWADVQFQRMPNVSLLPGDKDLGWDDLIAATDRGIAMIGRASYSIDQQRYNAQFGAQLCYEVRGGKIVGQLRDVAYQMRTPEFWRALDMVGGPRSYQLGGSFFDGKGQPGQVNAVSHGCPPSRFRQVNVINTGRQA